MAAIYLALRMLRSIRSVKWTTAYDS